MIFRGWQEGPRQKKLSKFFGSEQLRFPGLFTAYLPYPNPYTGLHEACFTSPIDNSYPLGTPEFSFNKDSLHEALSFN